MPLNTKAKVSKGSGQLNSLARLSQNNPVITYLVHKGVVLTKNNVQLTHAR